MRSTSSSAEPAPDLAGSPALEVVRLGRLDYVDGLALQHASVDHRIAGGAPDRLLLLEHEAVITVGRGATRGQAPLCEIPVCEVERGGEVTYHGPGQLVGYPILALSAAERDLHRYLRRIEDALILALGDVGVAAVRNPPHTGVWVEAGPPAGAAGLRKLASIGVAVRRWVTFHGFALNVSTDLSAFQGFQPCGLAPTVMTSLAALGVSARMDAVAAGVATRFGEVFGRRVVWVDPSRLAAGACESRSVPSPDPPGEGSICCNQPGNHARD